MVTEANAINAATTGIVGNTGTAFTGTAVTQYNILTGAATSSTLNNVAPSATSGVPVISQGASAQPIFGTAVVAGGGTGVTSSTAYGLITGGTTTTNPFQTVTPGTSKTVVISGGTAALHSYTSAFKITSDVMTNTAQPCFLATVTTTVTNVTGNATVYTVIFNATQFDQGSNFNTTTGTFTAPVTGKYFFDAVVYTSSTSTIMTAYTLKINATSRTLGFAQNYSAGSVNGISTTTAGIIDMTANDTATVTIQVSGGAGNTASVFGSASPYFTYFSGYLIC